jgi:hypothetical protein
LYGANNEESTTIDVVYGVMDDLAKHVIPVYYEKDEIKKAELKKDLEDSKLSHYMKILDDILIENDGGDGFFVGKSVSFLLSLKAGSIYGF